jgi:carbon monoxide dehydrogenase subunit G
MEIKGTHKFAAPPQRVWDALHNGLILKNAIPGAEMVDWQGNSSIVYRGSIGAGPLNLGTVTVDAQVVEQSAPTHMTVAINKASASGTVAIDLAPDGSGTVLTYTAAAQLSGPAAIADNFAMRPIVDGVIGQVFSRLESQIH